MFTATDFPLRGRTAQQVTAALAAISQAPIITAADNSVVMQEYTPGDLINNVDIRKHPNQQAKAMYNRLIAQGKKIMKVLINGQITCLEHMDISGQEITDFAVAAAAYKIRMATSIAKQNIYALLVAAIGEDPMPGMPIPSQ